MTIDIREHPAVIDAINMELSHGEIVELKFERQVPGDTSSPVRLVVIGISRKVRHFEKVK